MLEHYAASYGDVEARCLVRILRYVDKMVAHRNLGRVESRALIAQKKERVPLEGMFLDRPRVWCNFDATDFYVELGAVLFHLVY